MCVSNLSEKSNNIKKESYMNNANIFVSSHNNGNNNVWEAKWGDRKALNVSIEAKII